MPPLTNSAHGVNAELEEYMRLIEATAARLMQRLPGNVRREDLVQAGALGLLELLHDGRAERSGNFLAYIGIRIHGAMLDEVRRHDWSSRSANKGRREIDRAIRTVETRLRRPARNSEIAREMGTDLDTYYALVRKTTEDRVHVIANVSAQDDDISEGFGSDSESPDKEYENACLRNAIDREVENLTEQERLVFSLCFVSELSLRQIGELFGLTESRICQIRNGAISHLRSRLKAWRSEYPDPVLSEPQSFFGDRAREPHKEQVR